MIPYGSVVLGADSSRFEAVFGTSGPGATTISGLDFTALTRPSDGERAIGYSFWTAAVGPAGALTAQVRASTARTTASSVYATVGVNDLFRISNGSGTTGVLATSVGRFEGWPMLRTSP
jgi:hypothetical protein